MENIETQTTGFKEPESRAPFLTIRPKSGLVDIYIRIEADTADWLKDLAERSNRSQSDVARQLLNALREDGVNIEDSPQTEVPELRGE